MAPLAKLSQLSFVSIVLSAQSHGSTPGTAPSPSASAPGFSTAARTTSPTPAATHDGLSLRLSEHGEFEFVLADRSGTTRILERQQLPLVITALNDLISRYPCSGDYLPETGLVKYGMIELSFNVREICEAKELGYGGNPASQNSPRSLKPAPRATAIPAGTSPAAPRPSTTGFGGESRSATGFRNKN
jgi:hypothetical protein